MTSDTSKELRAATPTKPYQYSEKLESLLSFLEEHCEQKYDSGDKLSNECGGREADVSTSRRARTGLADISNSARASTRTGEDEEEIKEQHVPIYATSKSLSFTRATKTIVTREKKYIWEDWEETMQEGEMVLIGSEPKMPSCDEIEERSCPPSNGLPVDAHQQLQELRSMSEEIQTRAAAMKIELDHKSKKVDELHSIRVKNESEHVETMKLVKQECKKRIECAQVEHDTVAAEQQNLEETLANDCDMLEKKMSLIISEIERKEKSELDICERLRRDETQQLAEVKSSWQQTEKDELKKRDKRMSPKLKQDAAKAVEPKLRQLMERNKEEIDRLEREAARELDCYKLELFRQTNEEYKRETNKIRADERERMSHVENEWVAKMESCRRDHENEKKKAIEENEQRSCMRKRQFNADKQKCMDEHEVMLDDAKKSDDFKMEQIRVRHEQEMRAMEDEYSERMNQNQKLCEEDFVRWKERRESELQNEEDRKRKEDHAKAKLKVQSDIDLVRKKLGEEQNEKRQQSELAVAQRKAGIKEKYDAEIQKMETELKKVTNETTTLRQKEARESHFAKELQKKHSRMKESIQEKEDQVATKERRLAAFSNECDQEISNLQQDGERIVKQTNINKASLEKELDRLIANRPKQQDSWALALDELKALHDEEIALAEKKVRALLDRQKAMLEAESAKLFSLRKETADMDRELDNARKTRVLGERKDPD